MDKRMKQGDKRYLLAAGEGEGNLLRAITRPDADGNQKTAELNRANLGDFFSVNPNDNALEAFLKKFMEQMENPSHIGLFLVTEKFLEKVFATGKVDAEELEQFRIHPEEVLAQKAATPAQSTSGETTEQKADEQKPTFEPFDPNRINVESIDRLGINWKDVEPHLKAMLFGHKSPGLVPMVLHVEGMEIPTTGRLSLAEQADGELYLVPHFYHHKLDLDIPFQGVLLSDADKEHLLATGNAGRIINLEPEAGKIIPSYVSIDKITNTLEAIPTEKVSIPQSIKGAELTNEQCQALAEGRKVLIESMTSRTGALFDAYLQINASRGAFDFSYDGLDRNRYRSTKEGEAESNRQSEHRNVRIPQKLLGVDLPEKQQEELRAGKTIYVKGMMKDGQDQPFNAYVRVNAEAKKLDFYKWNPDRAKKQGAEVTPAQESRTQVAVNSEGKTNEATKHVTEPLKQEQIKPTAAQSAKTEKRRGVRIA
jgi:hypothetical protein